MGEKLMKIKEGYVLRKVADCYVAVPIGKACLDFNGMITLNETGAFLWGKLVEGMSKEELLDALLDNYEISKEAAEIDVSDFINKIKDAGFFE
jgi:hypothetical protein